MQRLSQLWVCRPSATTATAATVFCRGALGLSGAAATHTPVRYATTQRRILRPTEEGVADLMDDDADDETNGLLKPVAGGRGGGAAGAAAQTPVLSSVMQSASLYRQAAQSDSVAEAKGRHTISNRSAAASRVREQDGDEEGDEDENGAVLQQQQQGDQSQEMEASEEAARRASEALNVEEEAFVAEQQAVYYEMPVQQLTDVVCAYLRSTENVAIVSAKEEHALFPVLQDRLIEFHVTQLLDVVECHWSRSTMLRYGTVFQDAVRDRIAQLATAAAAAQLESKKQRGTSLRESGASGDVLPDEEENEEGIFVQDPKQQQQQQQSDTAGAAPSGDVILANADAEITSATVFRAVVVTGMSAGHRKRDRVFFQLLGSYLTYFINDYRDPNELVRVLTALARAKVIPSPAFLNLLARRLPALHKRVPLQPVPAYRAMSNFARMGHTSINTFRFLADCTVSSMEKNIRDERKKLKAERGTKADEEVQQCDASTPAAATAAAESSAHSPSAELLHLRADVAAKQRMRRLCGLKPSNFTRLLFLLARFNAPHQQYLRPLIRPVILPMLPYFPPPSFTRLLKATQLFRSTDAVLIDAFVAHVCDVLAPAGHLTRPDVLELLHLISYEDTPIPARLADFLAVCCTTLRSATSAGSDAEANKDAAVATPTSSPARGTVTLLLRPLHMCRVLHSLGGLQRRVEIPLETLAPLVDLADDFARHLAFLMELGVVPLHDVDEFVSVCARHQIPDRSGAVEQLAEKRREVAASPRSATRSTAEAVGDDSAGDGEEDYYSHLDLDVRETFVKIFIASDFTTYGGYRPLPGPLQVDFRDELTRISAFELLQAVDLFDKACPGALHSAPRMYLSRSFFEKVSKEGEVVVQEETNELIVRQPRAQLLTREDLVAFVALVQRTPLEAVRKAPATWHFIREKAERLGVTAAAETATQQLRELHA